MTEISNIRPHVNPQKLGIILAACKKVRWINTGELRTEDVAVNGISVNSSDIEEGWLFVAVPGEKAHGARYASLAIAHGAAAILTDEEGAHLIEQEHIRIPIAVVEDPRISAPLAAAEIYLHPAEKLTTMAITGTNGKTTTSYLMRTALQNERTDVALCGTIEVSIGDIFIRSDHVTTYESPVIERILALAVEKGCSGAVVETSAHAMSLHRVDGIIFDVAGFTNLQHDHLDYYKNMENYYQAKKILFTPEHAKCGVVCIDDKWGKRLAGEAAIDIVTVAALSDNPADWTVHDIRADQESWCSVFSLTDPNGNTYEVRSPIPGAVNIQNVAVAIVSAVSCGRDIRSIIASFNHASHVPGRMQKVNPFPRKAPLVIVDFAHTPEGLEWTLSTASALTRGEVLVVFGTDGERDPSKRSDLGRAAANNADKLWVTDENPRYEDPSSIRSQILEGVFDIRPDGRNVEEVTTSRRDAIRHALRAAGPDDTVMITGKGPEWYQEIEGIRHSFDDVREAEEMLRQIWGTDSGLA